MTARLASHVWLVFLVLGLVVATIAALIGDEAAALPALTVMGMLAVGAIVIGVRRYQPTRRRPWLILAVGTLLTTLGTMLLPPTGPPGAVAATLTAVGALAGFVGFVMLIRGRIPGGDRPALLDAAILACGVGIVIWAFGLASNVLVEGVSSIVAEAAFFPDLIVFGLVARMWFLEGAHRPATRLIVLNVVAANGIVALNLLPGIVDTGAFAGLTLLARFAQLVFIAAAALHPSMAIAPERQHVDQQPISRRRIVALALALLVNPVSLAIQAFEGRPIDPAPYLIGGVVIGVLVIARLGDALRQLGDGLQERGSLLELLRRQALYDALTSLPNRTLFSERLAGHFKQRTEARQLAVLLIDLDDFKAVNDTYGHETGDALLVMVGQRLRGAIRVIDTAARLGGDEFVIALPSCTDSAAPVQVAERVIAALGAPFEIGGHRLTVRACIGVATARPEDASAEALVRNADVAMYLAKSRGKGRFEVFEPSMHATAASQLQLRVDLEAGIRAGDLRLAYQPVVDLRSGRTVGYEALVRWQRPSGLVAPAEFIPTAESSGLIGPLTDWVLDEACRVTSTWGRGGDRPWVSVNMSSSQLIRPDIVERVRGTLGRTGLAAGRLIIEITESSLLEIDLARPAIERLSGLGVRLAIDDFGIGYSALSYLARLPIDIVKIDRSFVVALEHDGPGEAIASAIIALARRLGITTIGEGIETVAQLQQLVALDCDLGQGFHLGRPVAGEDLRPLALPAGERPRGPSDRPRPRPPRRLITPQRPSGSIAPG